MKRDLAKIHPELQQMAKKMPSITYNRPVLWLVNTILRMMPAPKAPNDVLIETAYIPRSDDSSNIRVRIYKPVNIGMPTPALIWFHGGGYVLGVPEQDDALCIQFVRGVGVTVVSVDYRFAPQHPFPAGLEDGYATLKWVAAQSHSLGIDEKSIAVGGASAGAGLAAALAQLAHDRREVRLAFQLLSYPMLDDRTVLRMDVDDSYGVTWNQKNNKLGWEAYLSRECGAADVPEYSVPARRKYLTGLPPAWIGVGSLDLFHDEDKAYANRLKECGVACEFVEVPGAFHGFDVFDQTPQVVQDFRRSQFMAMQVNLYEKK